MACLGLFGIIPTPTIEGAARLGQEQLKSDHSPATAPIFNAVLVSLMAALTERGSCQMFVCLCTGVTSEVIEELVVKGAASTREIAKACGAGMECGRCRRTVRAIIAGNGVQ